MRTDCNILINVSNMMIMVDSVEGLGRSITLYNQGFMIGSIGLYGTQLQYKWTLDDGTKSYDLIKKEVY